MHLPRRDPPQRRHNCCCRIWNFDGQTGPSKAGEAPTLSTLRRRSSQTRQIRQEDQNGTYLNSETENATCEAFRGANRCVVQRARKEGADEPSDSDDSSVGGVINDGRVLRKIRKEYFTPGMMLEFESSDDEDDESLLLLAKRRRRRRRNGWGLIATAMMMRMERMRNEVLRPRQGKLREQHYRSQGRTRA